MPWLRIFQPQIGMPQRTTAEAFQTDTLKDYDTYINFTTDSGEGVPLFINSASPAWAGNLQPQGPLIFSAYARCQRPP